MLLYSLPGGCQVIFLIVIVIVFTPWRLSGNLNCYFPNVRYFSFCFIVFISIGNHDYLTNVSIHQPSQCCLQGSSIGHQLWFVDGCLNFSNKIFLGIFFCKLSRFVHLTPLHGKPSEVTFWFGIVCCINMTRDLWCWIIWCWIIWYAIFIFKFVSTKE